ncbi:hypothetical protein R1flu_014396 [Riccia fluitans]|uniref:Uncharacterized protein n=1 Tax=Riccia fluitans TaxID=41844 RepID=A0ABD1YGP7_9MARC
MSANVCAQHMALYHVGRGTLRGRGVYVVLRSGPCRHGQASSRVRLVWSGVVQAAQSGVVGGVPAKHMPASVVPYMVRSSRHLAS